MDIRFGRAAACISLFWTGTALSAGVAGIYGSPLGPLRVEESAGVVRATLTTAGGPCDFPKGKLIFQGSLLDDNITGTWHACRLGPGCQGEVAGMAMWLVTREGAVWSGAAHLDAGACQLPWTGHSLTLHRTELVPERPASTSSSPALDAPKTPPPAAAPPAAAPAGPTRRGTSTRSGTPSPQATQEGPRSARARAEALAGEGARLLEEAAVEAARARFVEATRADPSYSEAWVGVGVTYYVRDRYDEALEHYKRGLEANPGNRDAYYNMACIYALRGDPDLAMRYLEFAQMNGYVDVTTLAHDPDLRSLHARPDFRALAQLPDNAPPLSAQPPPRSSPPSGPLPALPDTAAVR